MAATLTETRQFYTLYNTLEDQKAYMQKEVRARARRGRARARARSWAQFRGPEGLHAEGEG